MVKVDPDQLREHAAKLMNGPLKRVETAADAAEQAGFGDSAEVFGKFLKDVIPPIFENHCDDTRRTLASAGGLGEGFGDTVKEVGGSWETEDQEAARLLNQLVKDLPGGHR